VPGGVHVGQPTGRRDVTHKVNPTFPPSGRAA
jgi:hypothetical protein